jgi:hypothetical protein
MQNGPEIVFTIPKQQTTRIQTVELKKLDSLPLSNINITLGNGKFTKLIPEDNKTIKCQQDILACNCSIQNTEKILVHMMKFPRPRKLEINEYPDLTTTQPELLKYMVNNFISPPPGSDIATYIEQTIQFLKSQHKEKTVAARVNNININRTLPFVSMKIPPLQESIQCLVDTGAANSLQHSDIAKQLPIKVQATSIKLVTATGSSNTAVQGIAHIYFELPNSSKKIANLYCTTFIVTNQLFKFKQT